MHTAVYSHPLCISAIDIAVSITTADAVFDQPRKLFASTILEFMKVQQDIAFYDSCAEIYIVGYKIGSEKSLVLLFYCGYGVILWI